MRKIVVAVALVVLVIAITVAYSVLQIYRGGRETTTTTSTGIDLRGVVLQGAGATFVYPQLSEWARIFQEKHGVRINYQSVGSGAGQSMFFQKVVDFGCSDPPLSRGKWQQYKGSVLQVPWLFGPAVVVYNIPELPRSTVLRLDGVAIAMNSSSMFDVRDLTKPLKAFDENFALLTTFNSFSK